MKKGTPIKNRVFKSSWFAKKAKKAGISDSDLCEAAQQIMKGQCDDLGGGVFKKRLNENRHRSIILARCGKNWIYEFLFAKKDLANIDDCELMDFRRLAKIYANLSEKQLAKLIKDKDLVEIFDAKNDKT